MASQDVLGLSYPLDVLFYLPQAHHASLVTVSGAGQLFDFGMPTPALRLLWSNTLGHWLQ